MNKNSLQFVLTQKGHSGIIEGNCFVHHDKNFSSPSDYFTKGNVGPVEITFSCGAVPLGKYTFRSFDFSKLDQGLVGGFLQIPGGHNIDVTIELDVNRIAPICRFQALYSYNEREDF